MSKKVTLPGRESSNYGKVTAWMRKARVYTRAQVFEQFTNLGLKEDAADASTTVLLSPRLTARDGCDPRGNMSCPWGHVAYNEKLARVADSEQQFRFRMRKVAMEARKRTEKIEVAPAKSTKSPAQAEVKTEATAKV